MPAFSFRHRYKWGIASSVTLSMVFIIVLLMGLVTFVDIKRERTIARNGLERYGILMANSLDEVLANDLYFSQIDSLQDIAEVLVSQPQIAEVKIFRPDGRLLIEEPRLRDRSAYATGYLSNPTALGAVQSGSEWRRFGDTTLELAIPVSSGGDLLGGVQFSFTAEALNEEIRSIILSHVLQGLALIALGSALAYLIARRTSRSIGELAAVAGEIGRGKLDVQAPSRGTKETVELGQALEGMRVQLKELYPNLEQRVEERTTELSRAAQRLQVEVAEREKAEQEQRRLTEESQLMAGIGRVIGSSLNVVEVYEGFAALVRLFVPCEWITIHKVDLQRGTWTMAYTAGAEIPSQKAGTVVPLAGTFTESVVQSPQGLVLHVDDSEECARNYPGLIPYLEAGARSFLGVPVVSRGEVIATLHMVPSAPIPYTDHHLELARSIGAQIAGAIANAETYSQREEAEQAARRLAAENHLLADVGRIITLSPNIDDVYQRFADRIREHIAFDYMSISLVGVEDGVSNSAYVSGIDVPGRRAGDKIPLQGALSEAVMRTRSAKLIEANSVEDLALQYPGLVPALEAGLRSFLAVPLITGDEVIAVLNLRSAQQNAYSERDLGLMEQVGRQIAPAIENARLFEQVKSNAEEMAALDEVARLITSSLDLEQVYERFAEEVKKLVDFDRISVNVIEEDAGVFTFKYSAGKVLPGRHIPDIVPMEGTQTQRVLETARTLVVPDSSKATHFSGAERFLQEGLKSSIMVPLIHQGRILGTMSLRSQRLEAYGDRDQVILERLASQIAPAVENAQLYDQLRSNAEEMAAIDEVGRIIPSNLDIDQVYEQFATEAKKHVPFDRIYINRLDLDSSTLEMKYFSGVPEEGLEPGRISGIEGTQSEVVLRTGESLVRHDIAEEQIFSSDKTHLAVGLRSSIAAPLISKGEVIGILGLRSRGVGTYGLRERIILERLASQIAPALENAQLFQRVDQLALAIANIGDGVCVTDPEGRILFVNQALEQILGYQPRELVGESIADLYPGGAADPGLESIMAGLASGGWSGEVELSAKDGDRIPSLETAAAIYDSGSRLVGFVCTTTDIRDRKLAEEELRYRNLELLSLSRRLVEVQEAERRHVARELHDEIGQVLTGLKLSLELIPRVPEEAVKANLEESTNLVNELMGKVRELSLDLRPAMLDDLGLLPTLLWYFERFTARTQVNVGFEHTGLDRRFLSEVETSAYRIVQEALTNVARHAGADAVSVRLWSNDEMLGLSIEDHGAGFDAADESILSKSNGLAGMRERATLLGGN